MDLPPGLSAEDLEPSTRPFGASWTLPPSVYTDPNILAWERRHFFDSGWVCAGRAADLARPGERRAVSLGHASVLLVVAGDGKRYAVANVCRHRGHELLPCGASADGPVITCPYHGWVYELDGRLRGAAGIDLATNADPSELGLVPVRHEEWGGFVFVNVSGDASPFPDVLGSLAGFAASHELDDLIVAHRHTYALAANWKLAIENYHECWHCPVIHPDLERRTAATTGEYLDNQTGAWVGGTMRFRPGVESMTVSGGRIGRRFRGAGIDDRMGERVAYVGLFPNLLLALHPDYVLTHRIEPISADRSTVTCEWLVPPDTARAAGFDPTDAVAFWDQVNRQDWTAVESVQRGVSSPLYRRGPLGIVEDDVYGFIQMVARGYQGEQPVGVRQGRKVR